MQRDDSFVMQVIGGEAILVPTGQKVVDLNGLVTLNATGRFIWECLAQPCEVEVLVESLCAEFEVGSAAARTDVAAFIDVLRGLGALV